MFGVDQINYERECKTQQMWREKKAKKSKKNRKTILDLPIPRFETTFVFRRFHSQFPSSSSVGRWSSHRAISISSSQGPNIWIFLFSLVVPGFTKEVKDAFVSSSFVFIEKQRDKRNARVVDEENGRRQSVTKTDQSSSSSIPKFLLARCLVVGDFRFHFRCFYEKRLLKINEKINVVCGLCA